ncbi:MAG: TIGR01777 family oxidoreductase [Chloroflexota bacterium]
MRVAVSGSSGLVGSALVDALEKRGDEVTRLVRRESRPGSREAQWNPRTGAVDTDALEGLVAVVHLAGESLAPGFRWTQPIKDRIRFSRVEGTKLLTSALARLERKPSVLVSASAIGYYGDRGDQLLDESEPPGKDFLGEVAHDWEAAARRAEEDGIRVVNTRFGLIIDKESPLLSRQLPFFRLGMGAHMGSGRQYMSWVALSDVVRAILFAIDNDSVSGPVNVTAPEPVRNETFVKTLAHMLNRPALAWVPAAILRVTFGEMASELLLSSQRAVPSKLQAAGFEFQHTDIESALRAALRA